MRYLVLLRGTPAIGKSTWIKENSLEQYTVSADAIRLLHQSPVTTIDGTLSISQTNDKKVWELLYSLVEERMARGEFTIVDATHSRAQAINRYKDMCVEYRYRCIVIDFTKEATLEEILERNASREPHKFVPEEAIRSIYARLENDAVPSWASTIKPNEFDNMKNILFDFTDKYDSIVTFGDIHSCLEPIEKYFSENPFNDKTMYIFVGDYFDRGMQHVELFNFLMSIKDKKNVLFLTGNHEVWLQNYINDKPVKSKDARDTIEVLTNNGITKSNIKQFTDKLGQIAYFNFNGNVYCITHGGIPNIPSIFTPSVEFIRGVGKYEDSETVDKSWVANTPDNYYSIHGHRNIFGVDIKNTERTFNLNGTPEFGGNLRMLKIKKTENGNIHIPIEIKNDTFSEDRANEISTDKSNVAKYTKGLGITPSSDAVSALLTHSGVKIKELGDGVFSINFDKKVFYKKSWCDITVKARGLFIDDKSNIVARSYNKFFNLNEMEETKPYALAKNLKFPVVSYVKENGFLGILSVHNGEWFIASKSTNKGDFKEYFEALIKPYLSEELKAYLADKSMVFEVIDMENDPHIIEYSSSRVVLLDVIHNEYEFSKLPYAELVNVGAMFEFTVKDIHTTLNSFEELMDYINIIKAKDELTPDIEGYVLEDANGYCFKIKEPYYNFWKKMRKFFEIFKKQGLNNSVKKNFHTENDFKVWNKIVETKFSDFDKSLIDIRKALGFL